MEVPKQHSAKYLGCMLNDKTASLHEVMYRITHTTATWKKMHVYLKQSPDDVKTKLLMYDAIIRSKLLYGLESAH